MATSSSERTAAKEAQPAATAPEGSPAQDAGQVEELLVEEISIDGMCGVY